MRSSARRVIFGAAVLLAGIIGMRLSSMDAADEKTAVPESSMKALVDQDIKNIETMVAIGKKGGAANTSKASRSIKSNAMMIAAFAQSRMGAKGADDAKLAAIRDAAIKIGAAAGKKNFAEVETLVKALKAGPPAAKGAPKPVDLVAAVGEFDIEELMYQLKKPTVGGLGVEEEIKDEAKKPTLAPDKVNALALRILVLADYCDQIPINGGFNAAKPKKAWDGFTKDMRTAAKGVMDAAGKKNAAALKTAFDKLDRSCVACHEQFK